MNYTKSLFFGILMTGLSLSSTTAFAETVLMFVAHEQTYYSEYIVMKEALEAAGYTVDVRSASTMDFSMYMSPYNDLIHTANDLSGSSYSEFQQQFLSLFGESWDESNNSILSLGETTGRLLAVESMDDYVGLVVVGGTGSLAYRVDGDYDAQGEEERNVSATTVQQTAEHLNDLAVEALLNGKPVMAQCHGASLAAFWRVPDTTDPNEVLGFSLLKGEISAGYPETETGTTLSDLDVTYRPNDRVTISSPHSSLDDGYAGTNRILTTRDWYPQTVAHAARTFLNILETYPDDEKKESTVATLVIHGGPLDPDDCGPGNKDNDVPCNHGDGDNLPADYVDLMSVLDANELADDFSIAAEDLDLSDEELPFDPNDEEEVLSYLSDYKVVVFFKHWSNYLTDEMLQAIVTFADQGGGVIGLHHALYNDMHEGQNKDVLVTELFGAQSTLNGWAANLTNFGLYATDHGHFISSYLIGYDDVSVHPEVWDSDPLPSHANTPYSTLPYISVYDELYINFDYTGDIPIGRGVNTLTPLFSNSANPPQGETSQSRPTGFTHIYDGNEDGTMGKVVYMALGERKENVNRNSTYAQMIRNAVLWSAGEPVIEPVAPIEQEITFESVEDKYIDDDPFDLVASTTSELDLVYEVTSGPATVSQQTVTLTGITGVVDIEISQAGNDDYLPASTSLSFNVMDVNKSAQTITFDPPENLTFGDDPLLLGASSSSGLDVNLTVVSGPATLDDLVLTLTGAGTVVLRATQAGDETFNPAPQLDRSVLIEKAEQEITFEPISDLPMTSAPFQLVAEASSGLEVSFSVDGPAVLDLTTLTLESFGTVTVTATQSGNENYKSAESEQSFESEFVLGIGDEMSKWRIYPNPSNEYIELNGPRDVITHLEFYQLSGALVLSKNISGYEKIIVRSFKPGLYLLRIIEDNQEITTTKILVTR
ncbi:MAG: ThuA domain-containing protein [Reichenbachiella sp.]|uniref:ThuA domain-containing protein n=1 Tax=Reichenbachiella sp. TaxID=2184521 RepID=UPI0032635999